MNGRGRCHLYIERLVRHASPGRMDSELLGRLIDRFAAALELYARQWCDAPEDVVQEAFVKLASQHVLPREPGAWLFRTVRNGAISAGIACRRRRRHEAEAAAETPGWFEAGTPGSNLSGVDPEAAQTALSALPVDQREVIVSHLWGGLTFQQIAEVCGTSSSSAHRQYQAGIAALRKCLGVSCHTNTPRRTTS
jgi:RNA polymerase sigma-70 factor (ECF subfamily)